MDRLKAIAGAALLSATTAFSAVSFEPITPGATESAKKLYNFLATNYTKRTVAGIQTGDINTGVGLLEQEDLLAVKDASGKFPALVGFDFLFANGVNASQAWQKSYTEKTVALAKELWDQGGIPSFTWHWKDPSDAVDAFYTQGAGDPYTTFDFSNAFLANSTDWDTNSDAYNQIIADIDEISAYFAELQTAGVAVIFRPLHEAGGTWFWWSTQEGKEYAALYQLIYTRMTTVNNIKNLVWVYNPQESIFTQGDWNPGSNFYDIIGVDIYNNAFDYQSNVSAYNAMETQFGTDKILTLSENGPIPDASLMHTDGAVWSWYMPWYNSWDGKFVEKTNSNVWTANVESECIITLDKMPQWSNYQTSTTLVDDCTVGYELGKLDTANVVEELLPDTSNGNGWMKVHVENMRYQVDEVSGDTTVPAAANIFIQPSADLTGSTTLSFDIYNTSLAGVWVSSAVLTNGTWLWEMPPDGCWINPQTQITCTMDVSSMSMDNVAKLYIMVATDGYTGTLYIDNMKTNVGLVASFNQEADLFTREQVGAEEYITELSLLGGGDTTTSTLAHFANPAFKKEANGFSFELNSAASVEISVFDLQGKEVHSSQQNLSQGNHFYSLQTLPAGFYTIQSNINGIQSTQKLLVK